ncbi:LD-carboxypeptidase [Undibacterium sp.]|uniref:S66 peptidase family protein n=1 Tax=Undibacterium sp. TaxID=1914977 RepID=UPI002D08B566|nr:LD-carboxypeptidase [Undibacterium sp.]HTD05866.1 LD-carboxypeptidase [Undibacterium sp.]
MTPSRRQFAQTLAAATGAFALGGTPAHAQTASRLAPIYPKRLKPGDTIGLVSPAAATYEREPVEIAIETMQALGFKVKQSPYLRARYGHFGGTDAQRAEAVNSMFADDSVDGILALTGGSGCNRIVDKLDYALIRKRPKFFGGYSDLTSLVNAIQAQTGLVTFHSPVAASEWNEFSVSHFRAMVMEGQAPLLRNPNGPKERGDNLVQTQDRIHTLRGGRARGPLVGGNLAVLTSLAGSAYWPDFRGAILFLEEVNEYIYRVDRMLSQLRLSGALQQVRGVVIGKFTKCTPGEGYGTLTLDEVFDDYFLPLNIPVFSGATIGHIKQKFTMPVGCEVEMDADAGSIQLLRPAVA